MKDAHLFFQLIHVAEEPVVRPYEKIVAAYNKNRSPLGAHAGVYHRYVNGLRGKAPVGGHERESARVDVVRRNLVSDIHDSRLRIDAENRSLHRSDEIVRRAEIG
jgi:hypothetical protein